MATATRGGSSYRGRGANNGGEESDDDSEFVVSKKRVPMQSKYSSARNSNRNTEEDDNDDVDNDNDDDGIGGSDKPAEVRRTNNNTRNGKGVVLGSSFGAVSTDDYNNNNNATNNLRKSWEKQPTSTSSSENATVVTFKMPKSASSQFIPRNIVSTISRSQHQDTQAWGHNSFDRDGREAPSKVRVSWEKNREEFAEKENEGPSVASSRVAVGAGASSSSSSSSSSGSWSAARPPLSSTYATSSSSSSTTSSSSELAASTASSSSSTTTTSSYAAPAPAGPPPSRMRLLQSQMNSAGGGGGAKFKSSQMFGKRTTETSTIDNDDINDGFDYEGIGKELADEAVLDDDDDDLIKNPRVLTYGGKLYREDDSSEIAKASAKSSGNFESRQTSRTAKEKNPPSPKTDLADMSFEEFSEEASSQGVVLGRRSGYYNDEEDTSLGAGPVTPEVKKKIPKSLAELSRNNGSRPFVHTAHERGTRTEHVQCVIVRDRGTLQSKLYPAYELILEENTKTLILARKMKMNRTSNYHLFDMTRGQAGTNLSKKSGNYLGKLRAKNLQRTEYILVTKSSEREEVAGIMFDRLGIINQLKEGSQPRKLTAILPPLDSEQVPVPHRAEENGSGSISEMLREESYTLAGKSGMHVLETKDPVYENGNYRLNFHGRVSMPSVKNFQLVSPDDIEDIICQFGKVGEDRFHLDFKAPLNAFQAFSLALCQFNL